MMTARDDTDFDDYGVRGYITDDGRAIWWGESLPDDLRYEPLEDTVMARIADALERIADVLERDGRVPIVVETKE